MQYYILVFLLNYLLYKWQDGISYNTETTNSYYRVLSIVLRSILWSRYTKPKIWKLETKPRWKRDIELIYICRSISVFQQFSLFWHFTQKVCWFELKYYWLTDGDYLSYQMFVMKKLSQSTKISSFYSQISTDRSLTDWIHIIVSH